MSEHSMSKIVMKALKGLDPVRVENPAHPGTPDINYCGYREEPDGDDTIKLEGWIELKELDAWPKRESTIVRVEHFTNEQRIWLERRWDNGGAAWLLLKVEQDWLLLTGHRAARLLGNVTKAVLVDHAAKIWRGSAIKTELKEWLLR